MGGSSKSSNDSSFSSSSNTTNNNIDRRQVVAEGGMGLAADGSTINVSVQSVDAGIVGKALDTVAQADATNGEGFSKLLTQADKLITGAGEVIQKTQNTTLAQIEAVNAATNDKAGNIDQKTIMVGIGVAGAVAVAIALGGKK